jgi:ribosomal-protein-alanine N-acetyltransferase
MPPESIETPRLTLRQPHWSDASAIFEQYAHDDLVSRYLAWRTHQNLAETGAFLRSRIDEWPVGQRTSWVITLRDNDQVIGMISQRQIMPYRVSLAYVLGQAFWNQGLMTEAAQAVVNLALGRSAIYRVEAYCDVENIASARVLEKVGFQREGVLRRSGFAPNLSGEPRGSICYAKVK